MSTQFGFFEPEPAPYPEGFRYQPSLITADEESALLTAIVTLPFREFEFHGYTGKRRVISFGWKYDFSARSLDRVDDIPDFLLPLREKAAEFAQLAPTALRHVLVTEYAAGAGIGWHRDKNVFGVVIGISLRAPCAFRLRRKMDDGWERVTVDVQPRSVYLLSGPARTEWEHSIPAVDALRYSITYRELQG